MIPAGIEERIRPPRLGTIGLGIVEGHGKEMRGKEVSYFVVAGPIAKVYGEQPTTLRVRFPWPEPEQVLHSIAYTLRQGRSVVRRCDGRYYSVLDRAGQDITALCERPNTPYAICPTGCRATAQLSVVVPRTPFGVWTIRIGGSQRVADLLAELRLYRAAVGPLTQLPFEIQRVETQEQYFDADGKVRTRKGYPVRLRCPYTDEEVVAIQSARGLPMMLPPAPDEEDVLDDDGDEGHPPVPDAPPTADQLVTGVDAPAASPMGTEPSRPESVPTEVEVDDEPWEISMAFRAAAKIGISTMMYEKYLLNRYGQRSGDLRDEDVRQERQRLEKPGDGQAVRRLVAEVAMVASGGRRGA